MTRRQWLTFLASAPNVAASFRLSQDDDAFLEDLEHRCFLYFVEQWHPETGLFRDRSHVDGDVVRRRDKADIASLAASGFGLTALCIGAERRWISRPMAEARVLTSLRFLAGTAYRKKGWFYHFLEFGTGERRWHCEASSIDTAFALAGILTARRYFGDNAEIVSLASKIYSAVDFSWMLNGHPYLFSHGWSPGRGFLRFRWDKYSEQTILYLLAIAAPRHPIPPEAWFAWTRPFRTYGPYTYLASVGPVFIHQYSHAWIDFRGRTETRGPAVDYFENSITATRAHRAFCIALSKKFPKSYSADCWGITASDSARGYKAWGGPPVDRRIDGTVAPCATGGSLMFTPDICVPGLRFMHRNFGNRNFGRYGFVDAFNPTIDWFDSDVLGIDLGITLLSAENLRTGNVWRWFMANPEFPRTLDTLGLAPEIADPA